MSGVEQCDPFFGMLAQEIPAAVSSVFGRHLRHDGVHASGVARADVVQETVLETEAQRVSHCEGDCQAGDQHCKEHLPRNAKANLARARTRVASKCFQNVTRAAARGWADGRACFCAEWFAMCFAVHSRILVETGVLAQVRATFPCNLHDFSFFCSLSVRDAWLVFDPAKGVVRTRFT